MDKRTFKNKAYGILAKLVKAMANPHRLEIIDLLGQGERSVEQIGIETGMPVANVSQHLQILKQSNLVWIRREGNFIYYNLAGEKVYKSWRKLRIIGMESISEINSLVEDFRMKKNSLESVTLDELLTKMASRKVVLLDIRPAREYNAGHIPKAINMPIDSLRMSLKGLSRDKQYIAYCRGVFCVFADEAVQLLRKNGFNAVRLDEGFPDYKALGQPVEMAV
ncbi:MAG TPA: metalloregulator ArsR/SmtB family transcription factor [Puia sp.]|nr:metalloregulator ArsR/SmtB family transcription factor [Puia sp.]